MRVFHASSYVNSTNTSRHQCLLPPRELDQQPRTKPGHAFRESADIEVREDPNPFASRGGLKLQYALEVFDLDCKDKTVVDIGASTGGFTDCLLQQGAKKVFAIDVGYGQIDWKLRKDSRVTVVDRKNARTLTLDDVLQCPRALHAAFLVGAVFESPWTTVAIGWLNLESSRG